jgi:hypothetical protein
MSSILTIHVPMTFRQRGGRKIIVAPDGSAMPALAARSNIDNVLVKALARAFRWQKLLDRGNYSSIKEIAARERINPSYVGDVLRLTLLAPDIVETILDGKQPPSLQFEQLRKLFPIEWQEQRSTLDGPATSQATPVNRGHSCKPSRSPHLNIRRTDRIGTR